MFFVILFILFGSYSHIRSGGKTVLKQIHLESRWWWTPGWSTESKPSDVPFKIEIFRDVWHPCTACGENWDYSLILRIPARSTADFFLSVISPGKSFWAQILQRGFTTCGGYGWEVIVEVCLGRGLQLFTLQTA